MSETSTGVPLLDLHAQYAPLRAEILAAIEDELRARGYDGADRPYLEAWGIGCTGKEAEIYAALAAENPGLIYCSIAGYSSDGSEAGRPGGIHHSRNNPST